MSNEESDGGHNIEPRDGSVHSLKVVLPHYKKKEISMKPMKANKEEISMMPMKVMKKEISMMPIKATETNHTQEQGFDHQQDCPSPLTRSTRKQVKAVIVQEGGVYHQTERSCHRLDSSFHLA